MRPLILSCIAIMVFLSSAQAALADISGVVKDSISGLALPEVTVYVKDNPAIKTASDQQGRFTITVNTGISCSNKRPSSIGIRISPDRCPGRAADELLSISGLTGQVRMVIVSVKGAIVWKSDAVWDGSGHRFTLPRLAPGLYFPEIYAGESRLRCTMLRSAGAYSNISILESRGAALTSPGASGAAAITLVFEKAGYLTKEAIVTGNGPVEMPLVRQPIPSTGGSGGLTYASNGKAGIYKYGRKMIGIVEVKVFEPADNKPRQLAFYLHGDGASSFFSDGGRILAFAEWAHKHTVMLVAALAPNKHSWWRAPEDNGSGAEIVDREGKNADALDSVINVLGKAYNLYKYPVLYTGVSGGSTFLSRLYVSRYGAAHSGALVMNGGGGSTLLKWDWDNNVDSLRNRNFLLFNYGSEDFLKPHIEGGIKAYRELHFAVDSIQYPGEGHCTPGIKIEANTITFWEKHLVNRKTHIAGRLPDSAPKAACSDHETTELVEGAMSYLKAVKEIK